MTETPSQEQEQAPDQDRVHTEHLRNFTSMRRTTYDRKIAGVAGGLARHLNIDPVIVRVLFVVLCFFGGAGFVLYGAAWLLVPEDTGKPAAFRTSDSTRNTLLIIAAAFAGLLLVGDSWGGVGFPWPLAIVALVVFAFMMKRDNSQDETPTTTATPTATMPAATYAPAATVSEQTPAQYLPEHGWQPVTPQSPPRKKKHGPILFGITIAVIAAAWGALGIYDSVNGHDVADAAYPALALGVTGLMLVVGSFFGRPGGLVLLGLVAAVAMGGASIADPRYDGDRNLEAAPTSSGQVNSSYHVPAGRIELDLRGVKDIAELDGRPIKLDGNAGEILVILPRGLSAQVDADVTIAGAITTPKHDDGGFGHSVNELVGDDADPTIDLEIDMKFGHIEVRQGS